MMAMSKRISRILSLAMAIAMALTIMMVSASAATAPGIQPYYDNEIAITAGISYAGQAYTASVMAPSETTQIKLTATLYQKGLLFYKEVDSASKTVYTSSCPLTKSYPIQSSKTYKLAVEAQVYCGGSWETITESEVFKT